MAAVVALGLAFGCRAGKTEPPERRASSEASAKRAFSDPCKENTECLKVGAVERCVPIVDPEHLEGATRFSGCRVGIKAGALGVGRTCDKNALLTVSGKPRERRCNACEAGILGMSSATGNVVPYKDGKRWTCAAGTTCDVVKCDVPPGHYNMLGRFGVLVSGDYRFDVEAIEETQARPSHPSPSATD
jgi:hypothetical protein